MGKTAAHNTTILVDGYELHGYLSGFDLGYQQETALVTAFQDAGPRRVVGNYDHTVNVAGLFDGTSGAADTILAGLSDDNVHYVSVVPGSATVGDFGHSQVVNLAERPFSGATGGAVLLNAAFQGTGQGGRVRWIYKATPTGTGQGTGYNLGTTSSGQTFAAFVHVVGGTYASITIRIQESTDDGAGDAYADISGMTTTITGTGESAVALLSTTAATEAWKRVSIQAFTGTDAIVRVFAGVLP